MTVTKTPTAPLRSPLARAAELWQRAVRPGRGATPTIAEEEDVKFTSIAERVLPEGRTLHLEGLVFHSALAVSSVGCERRGDDMVVEVNLTPVLQGKSGSFVVNVPLSAGIRRVRFGRELRPIWHAAEQDG